MDLSLLGLTSAFGLAASAGLNTTLPLLLAGLLSRFGLLALASPYDALSSPLVLGVLAVLVVAEFAGDKVPAVDSFVHAVQWPLAAAAGAILFASQTGAVTQMSPPLALGLGLLTASGVHGVRAAARPIVTTTTFGAGNPILSFVEDLYSLALAGTSVLLPAVALVLLALVLIAAGAVVFLAIRGGRSLTRRIRQLPSA